jgi:hypothetical protein
MEEMKAFERQVEHELHEMVGPIPRFDAVEIAETAVGAPRPGLLRRPRAMSLAGLAAAVAVLLIGIGIFGNLVPDEQGPVRIEGKGSFATIGEAVAEAVDGDVIVVGPGTYEETVEITTGVEIRGDGPDVVEFLIPFDGPAFRLRDANAVISGISFLSRAPEAGSTRRQAMVIDGGVVILEDLVARSDVPAEYEFVRLNATDDGSLIRGNTSSGHIIANRGAIATIEDNTLLAQDPEGPPVGIAVRRADVDLVISGNELNAIDIPQGTAEISGNSIQGRPLGESEVFGACGVAAHGESRPVLTDNRVWDQGYGICGQVDVRGGEIYDNDVGLLFEDRDPEDPRDPSSAAGAVIRDNGVGVQVGGLAPGIVVVGSDGTGAPDGMVGEAVLSDNAFCGNGVDVQAEEGANVVETGSTEC